MEGPAQVLKWEVRQPGVGMNSDAFLRESWVLPSRHKPVLRCWRPGQDLCRQSEVLAPLWELCGVGLDKR